MNSTITRRGRKPSRTAFLQETIQTSPCRFIKVEAKEIHQVVAR
jgi:hypothetical protein